MFTFKTSLTSTCNVEVEFSVFFKGFFKFTDKNVQFKAHFTTTSPKISEQNKPLTFGSADLAQDKEHA